MKLLSAEKDFAQGEVSRITAALNDAQQQLKVMEDLQMLPRADKRNWRMN